MRSWSISTENPKFDGLAHFGSKPTNSTYSTARVKISQAAENCSPYK